MARTKIKRRSYNVGNRQQAENVSREADRMLVEEPGQDPTIPPDVTETEEDDLPDAFLNSKTVKGQGDFAHIRVKDASDNASMGVARKPQENGLDMSLKSQANGLDLSPRPQENGLDLSPRPQEKRLDLSPKPQENGLDISSKPQENVLDMSLKPQENVLNMSPKLQENTLHMNDVSLESVSVSPILGWGQESTSVSQGQPIGLADIDLHISRDSPLNLAWDSSMKENYRPQADNPNFRPITPELIGIPVVEMLPPYLRKQISTAILTSFPNGPPPPPPVRPVRRPKKGDVPYIVGCTKRPRVPSPTSLTVFQGDSYGITDSTNCQEDEEQCSSGKRARRGPNGSGSLSKSRFNPQSNEIAERLKLHEKIDRLLGRTPKEPVSYMSKPRSFSPLPSTSTDNETILKNDKHFSESLNCDLQIQIFSDSDSDNDNFDIDDDDDLPEVLWDTSKYKQEKDRQDTPLAHVNTLNEDKKTHTDNVLTEINEDMNNNNDIISMDDDFCEIEFDKYMPKEKILDYSDVEVVKPTQESEVIETFSKVRSSANYNDVICVEDVSNRTSNVNPVSQGQSNTGTSVLRASNRIETSTETQSDLVIEVPDVLEPINMSRRASTSRLSVWNEDVQFVSEVRTSENPRGENIENVTIISQRPSSSQTTIRVPPDLSLQFLLDLSESYSKRKARSQSRKKSKKKKENLDVSLVNNENTAPSVNQARTESASQGAPTSPGKKLGECPICLDNLPTGSIASTNCGHVFCLDCIKQSLETTGKRCPTCRKKLRGVGYHQVFL